MSNGMQARVSAALRQRDNQTIAEIARAVGVHRNTATRYLNELILSGQARRSIDPTVNSPRGSGAYAYSWLAEPLPLPSVTEEQLCDRCATEIFGDPLRYGQACTPATAAKWKHAIEHDAWLYCDRCHVTLWEPWEENNDRDESPVGK